MPFAQGSRSQLTFVKEVTYGVTPSTPSMILLPINTHSIDLKKSIVQSGEIRPDRQVATSRHGNKSVAGDIVCELRADDYDPLLEAVMFGAFSSNVLKLGTTFSSYTFEDGQADIAQYRPFSGCGISTLELDIKPDAMVMATFGVVGKTGATISATPLDASPDPVTANKPFDSFAATVTEGGVSIAKVTSLKLKIENSLSPTFVIGSSSTPQLEYGRGKVSGELTAYYEDAALLNKFINETDTSLSFSLTDGTALNTYTFAMGTVKFNGGDVPLANEQSRMITIPFEALYNVAAATTLSITKS